MTYRRSLVKKIKIFIRELRPYRPYLLTGTGILILAGAVISLWPQPVRYDFGKTVSCTASPRFLPQLFSIEQKQPYRLKRPAEVAIGKLHLYAGQLCVTAVSAPAAGTAATYKERLFGWSILGRTVNIHTPSYPSLQDIPAGAMLPPDGTLRIKLTKPDAVFRYAVQLADRQTPCDSNGNGLECKLAPLQLTYAQQYKLSIVRKFNAQLVNNAAAATIKTLTPTTIVSTSIAPTANIIQKPDGITIVTDKKLTGIGTPSLVVKQPDGSETPLPASARIEGNAVIILFGQELPRKVAFEVRLSSLTAEDGSGLPGERFALAFTTSGGPKVTGANIGSRNVGTSQAMSISFDQPLLPSQDPSKLVNLTINGKGHPVAMAVSGNKIVLTPSSPLPLCAPFTIRVNEHVQSQYGIAGDSAWSTNSRVICYTTFSIGSSVRGRGITAYQFGEGPNPVVYMGGMHGSEGNSRTLMTEWFNELNANPGRLTARSLVVIPGVNPDGLASGSRLNANNIDLNRNFPAADWKSVVTSPDNPTPTPAGGPSPLSEPESRAVAAYIQRVRPRIVFSFHSAAAVVEANEAGDSVGIASTYAAKARYRAVPKSQSAPVFKYDTTGAMEDWMRDRLGSPAIVVELLSKTSSEFARNRDALWYTTGL